MRQAGFVSQLICCRTCCQNAATRGSWSNGDKVVETNCSSRDVFLSSLVEPNGPVSLFVVPGRKLKTRHLTRTRSITIYVCIYFSFFHFFFLSFFLCLWYISHTVIVCSCYRVYCGHVVELWMYMRLPSRFRLGLLSQESIWKSHKVAKDSRFEI